MVTDWLWNLSADVEIDRLCFGISETKCNIALWMCALIAALMPIHRIKVWWRLVQELQSSREQNLNIVPRLHRNLTIVVYLARWLSETDWNITILISAGKSAMISVHLVEIWWHSHQLLWSFRRKNLYSGCTLLYCSQWSSGLSTGRHSSRIQSHNYINSIVPQWSTGCSHPCWTNSPFVYTSPADRSSHHIWFHQTVLLLCLTNCIELPARRCPV